MGETHNINPKYPAVGGDTSSDQELSAGMLEFGGIRAVIDSLPMGVFIFDQQLKVVIANRLAREILNTGEYVHHILAEGTDRKAFGDWGGILRSVLDMGQKANFNAVEYGSNGDTKLLDIECTILKFNGENLPSGGAVVLQDVTEKVNMARQLSQSERFAAIGKVAGKVAHELNNPMDGILRYINMAIRSIEKNDLEKPAEYLIQCRQGLMRMTNIVSELLDFSRGSYQTFESTPLINVLEEAVKTIEPCAGKVKICIVKKSSIAAAYSGKGYLFQVFCNLIKNAVDAMEGAGNLDITIGSDDEMIVIRFSDTGPGFDDDNAEDIFRPFFTTKSHGNGTGLGLAICADLVKKHKGKITAENNSGKGSTFSVYLPL
jgi:signal transduction histidine kinase